MKKQIIYILILFTFAACTPETSPLENAKKLYSQSLENNDATTARVALNTILMYDSANTEYQDSLSRLYLTSGNFDGGLKYAELVYNSGNATNKLKENMALAYQQIGETEKADVFLGTLLEDTRDYKYLFQKVVIQYENGNQMMFDSLSNQILDIAKTDSLVANTMVPMPSPISGGNQLVPIEAATMFLIGNNAFERKQDIRTAVNYVQRSVQKFESFEMARYALMEIEKMMRGGR